MPGRRVVNFERGGRKSRETTWPPRRIWVEIVRKIRYNAVTAWGRRRVLYSGRKRETDMIPMLYADLIDDAGNRLRFEEIYETYCRQMFYKANCILRDEHEAEDAVHDAFIGIARNMKTVAAIANEQDLRYYVLRAAENAAYNRTRQTKHYTQAVPLENVPHVSDGGFWDSLCTRLEYEALVDIITALPRIYREVLYYHFVLEFSMPEVAQSLGLKLPTAKQRLVRGKKLLLQAIEREGGVDRGHE